MKTVPPPAAVSSAHSPPTSSTADIVKFNTGPYKGKFGVVVTLPDGQRFLAQQVFDSHEAALAQLRLHLKELGVADKDVVQHRMQ